MVVIGEVKDLIKVFVYGTLKRGHGNHKRLLAGRSIYVCDDVIDGVLYDLGHFPAVQEGEGIVHGEIYMVGPKTLRDLDRLEGHPTFYRRREVTTKLQGHDVWAYFLPELEEKMKQNPLPEGVWPATALTA